jgi:hypothetical protein
VAHSLGEPIVVELLGVPAVELAVAPPDLGIGLHDLGDPVLERLGVGRRDQRGALGGGDLAVAFDVAAHHRLGRRHRLEQHDAERLLAGRRRDEHIARAVQRGELVEADRAVIGQPGQLGRRLGLTELADDVERHR